jgi:tol-pal system protein YbgF
MITNKRICRAALAAAFLLLPSCMHMQQQLDTQQQALTILQNRFEQAERTLAQLRSHQADTQNDLGDMRREIMQLKGALEESAYLNQKALADLKAQLNQSLAALDRKTAAAAEPKPAGPAPEAVAPTGEQALYDRALQQFRNNNHAASRELFASFIAQYPSSRLIENALLWIGSSHYREKNYKAAIDACEEVITKYPRGVKAPDAYYLQALAFRDLKDPLTAEILLEEILQTYPESPAAASAKKTLQELQAQKKR